ncbi:MAG: cyclic nucleotide-binding domain-containing protein [Roseiflexaceae bacterium]|nr:cyclic nucleotide-binding domain-containing protein [Roseiflexaceae bacterium]
MTSRVIDNLRKVEILDGLTADDLTHVVGICRALRVADGRVIFNEGDEGDELYIIHEGSVYVKISTRNDANEQTLSTINTLYPGQCFGELVLLNGISRTATVVAAGTTTLIVIREPDFRALCDTKPQIGYTVMRNLAQDLAYKLRSSNLLLRGNIRWRGDELGKT